MRLAEELTFDEFATEVRAGQAMVEKAPHVGEEGVLEELQTMIVKSARILLVDLDDAAAATITPGQYSRISAFFNKLGTAQPAVSSENG